MTALHPTHAYAHDVVEGRVLAGRAVRLACERHLNDLKFGPKRGLRFDEDAADHVIEYFERFLCLPETEEGLEPLPFKLQPFQQFKTGCLFGWMGDDGYRRFRKAYIEESKGQGKTPTAAGYALFGLTADGESSAEIYLAAVTRNQANIAFRDVKKMAEASTGLKKRLHIGQHNISCGNSFLRPVSSEARSADGPRVHMAVIDELHEHPNNAVIEKMQAGTKGRKQPLIIAITNSGYDLRSVCWAQHEYSMKILEGALADDGWFSYMTQLDTCEPHRTEGKTAPQHGCKDCDDWTDEKVWPKAMPNLGVSVTRRYVQEQVREAQGMPTKENLVKRLNFCIWTEQRTLWITPDAWDACTHAFDPETLNGRACFGGLDLAMTTDFAAFVKEFPPLPSDPWLDVPFTVTDEDGGNPRVEMRRLQTTKWLARFWMPKDSVGEASRRDHAPYDLWVRQGFIEATEGNVIDYGVIRARIKEDAERYQIKEIGFDRYNATEIITNLMGDGLTMVPIGQGFVSMSAPCSETMKMIKGKSLAHNGHPLLRLMASNATALTDPAGNIKLDKSIQTKRIDGIVAGVMAKARASLALPAQASPYDVPGYQPMVFG